MTLFSYIRSDYNKYKKYGANFFVIVFLTQGFWASVQYRVAHYCYKKITLQPFRFIVKSVLFFWQKLIELTTGISIPWSAQIGHSFYIGHFGGIIFNSETKLGDNCNVAQNVTIGISGLGENRGVPIIGNNVYIAANAVIVGKITIEDEVLIGACSLVNFDVKAGCTVVGVPALVVSQNGSKGYI